MFQVVCRVFVGVAWVASMFWIVEVVQAVSVFEIVENCSGCSSCLD